MTRFRKGKSDVLLVAPDAKCVPAVYGWRIVSEKFGDLSDHFPTAKQAWEDAHDTVRRSSLFYGLISERIS